MNRRQATWLFWIGLAVLVLLIAEEVELPWGELWQEGILQVKYIYTLIFMFFLLVGAFVIYYIIRRM
ncbi:hypothetical protein JQN58_03600 [Aneurinibacillus sp. BA2021]|nr:hypothetical protein [Aneurinibacillus sp. BA2021]